MAHKCFNCNSYNTKQTRGGPASCSSGMSETVRWLAFTSKFCKIYIEFPISHLQITFTQELGGISWVICSFISFANHCCYLLFVIISWKKLAYVNISLELDLDLDSSMIWKLIIRIRSYLTSRIIKLGTRINQVIVRRANNLPTLGTATRSALYVILRNCPPSVVVVYAIKYEIKSVFVV